MSWARARPYLFAATIAVTVQFLLVSVQFPILEFLTDTPILRIDNGLHWYQLHVAVDLFGRDRWIAYDPTFAGGHVAGILTNGSNRVPSLLAVLFYGHATPVVTYKIYIFAAEVLAPLALVLAARQVGFGFVETLAAVGLGLLLWWASFLHWYHTSGMVAFVLASFLALPYALAVASYFGAKEVAWGRSLLLGLLGGLGVLLQPHFAVVVSLLLVALLRESFRTEGLRQLAIRGLPIAVVVGGVSLSWLFPMLAGAGASVGDQPYQKAIDATLIVRNALGLVGDGAQGAKVNMALLLGSLVAITRVAMRRELFVGLFLGWVLLSVVGALGAAVPAIAAIQPNRLLVSAWLPLILPAAAGFGYIMDRLRKERVRNCLGTWVVGAICGFSLAFASVELIREVTPGPHGRYGDSPPEAEGVGADLRSLLAWLQSETTRDARVLFETSLARVHDGSHAAGYLAEKSQREFIGGPYPHFYTASAWDGSAFGRPLEKLPVSDFLEYVRVFNIGWIVAHSEALRSYLRGVPDAVELRTIGPTTVYSIQRNLSFVLEGPGRLVESNRGGIRLDGLAGPRTVIAYSYVPGLRASDEGIRVVPVQVRGLAQSIIGLEGSAKGSVTIALESTSFRISDREE